MIIAMGQNIIVEIYSTMATKIRQQDLIASY